MSLQRQNIYPLRECRCFKEDNIKRYFYSKLFHKLLMAEKRRKSPETVFYLNCLPSPGLRSRRSAASSTYSSGSGTMWTRLPSALRYATILFPEPVMKRLTVPSKVFLPQDNSQSELRSQTASSPHSHDFKKNCMERQAPPLPASPWDLIFRIEYCSSCREINIVWFLF